MLQQIGTSKVNFSSNDTGMRWRVPPGGRPCQARSSCWALSKVLQFEAAWCDWPSRVDLETCSVGFGSFTSFLCLRLLFSSKNTSCKHYQLTYLVLIWNKVKKLIFPVVIHNTACTHDSPALYQGRLHTADKEKVKIENVSFVASKMFNKNQNQNLSIWGQQCHIREDKGLAIS